MSTARDETGSRLAGCQSANHEHCYGELWQCTGCGKVVCYAEGTDNHRELCDDCWVARFHAPPGAVHQGEDMKPSTFMQQLVHDLIKHYGAEVLPSGFRYLELGMYGYGVLAIEENSQQMCVCYWLYDAQGHPVPEPELVFHLDEAGHWFPIESRRHTTGHQIYAVVDDVTNALVVTALAKQEALAELADSWAAVLRTQGWVGQADKCITQPQPWAQDEEAPLQAPDAATLWDWVDEYGKCTATDGCWVEPQGVCEHGHNSWLVELGLL